MNNPQQTSPVILDTFIFENDGIYLKNYHVQRSQEALELIKGSLLNITLQELYNKIESDWVAKSADQMFRLQINPEHVWDYQLDVQPLHKLNSHLLLQPIFDFDYKKIPNSNYKWSDRKHWNVFDQIINESQDVLTIKDNLELVECSRFNLFALDIKKNIVRTPPALSGCLKGVYRQSCLENGWINLPDKGRHSVVESAVYWNELENVEIYVGNSVRKLIRAEIIADFPR